MIALKSFSNSIVGNIKEGQKLSDRVLKVLDVESLKKAGFIADEPKTDEPKTKKEVKK